MYVDARVLIRQTLESCYWRVAFLFGWFDIVLQYWAKGCRSV